MKFPPLRYGPTTLCWYRIRPSEWNEDDRLGFAKIVRRANNLPPDKGLEPLTLGLKVPRSTN